MRTAVPRNRTPRDTRTFRIYVPHNTVTRTVHRSGSCKFSANLIKICINLSLQRFKISPRGALPRTPPVVPPGPSRPGPKDGGSQAHWITLTADRADLVYITQPLFVSVSALTLAVPSGRVPRPRERVPMSGPTRVQYAVPVSAGHPHAHRHCALAATERAFRSQRPVAGIRAVAASSESITLCRCSLASSAPPTLLA